MKGLFAPLFPVFFLLSSSILALFKTFRNSDVFALILKRTILVKYYWYKLRTILLQALTPFCRLVWCCSLSLCPWLHTAVWAGWHPAPPSRAHFTQNGGWPDTALVIVPVMQSSAAPGPHNTRLSPQPAPHQTEQSLIFPTASSMLIRTWDNNAPTQSHCCRMIFMLCD